MSDLKFLKSFTKDFEEVRPALIAHKEAHKKLRSIERRLDTFDAKYNFILDVIGVDSSGNQLVEGVKKLFKAAGFKKVVHFKSPRIKPQREDLQLWSDKELFIIEVKGIKNINPANSDLMQVLPYLAAQKIRMPDKDIYGLSIINHDNKNHVLNRPLTFKDEIKEQDAKNLKFGFISTKDLVRGFWFLKTGQIDFEKFINSLKKYGLITYDSKGGQILEK